MSDSIERLASRIRAEHRAAPGASEAELDRAERRLGAPLLPELRRLLLGVNGAQLWSDADYPYRLLGAEELRWATDALGADEIERAAGLLCLGTDDADNYTAIGVHAGTPVFRQVVDCNHETFPFELGRVAPSLEAFLVQLLASGDVDAVWSAVLANDVDFADRDDA